MHVASILIRKQTLPEPEMPSSYSSKLLSLSKGNLELTSSTIISLLNFEGYIRWACGPCGSPSTWETEEGSPKPRSLRPAWEM
jgi:hypothetical protein